MYTHTHIHTDTHTHAHKAINIYQQNPRYSADVEGFFESVLMVQLFRRQAKFGQRASHPLGKTVLHIFSDVVPSRRPCLKTMDRKSFERSNFSVLHPVLLKIAYFKSANESFPLTYTPKSCDKEKLSIPLDPHHKAQSSEFFRSFQAKN